MSTRQRLNGFLALPLLAGLFLSGCAASEPGAAPASPSSTPTSSTSSSAAPAATSVEIGGTGVSVLGSSGEVITSVLYNEDPQIAVDVLTEAFGSAPALSVRPSDDNCVAEASVATWPEGFVLRYGMNEFTVPRGQLFELDATAATVGPVTIETPGGVRVGDPFDTLTAGLPAEQIMDVGETDLGLIAWAHYEVGSGTYVPDDSPNFGSPDYWGASARSIDGIVERLTAPVLLQNAC